MHLWRFGRCCGWIDVRCCGCLPVVWMYWCLVAVYAGYLCLVLLVGSFRGFVLFWCHGLWSCYLVS